MSNDKEFHCHMRTKLQPYVKNQICLAFFHGTGENYNLALLNIVQYIVHKMDFTDVIDLFTAAKTRKILLKCFFLRTCSFGFRSHLFSDQKFFCCQFNLKNTPFPIFVTSVISNVIYEYKAKVSSRTEGPN